MQASEFKGYLKVYLTVETDLKPQASLASCYSMECVKEQLVQSCEAGEQSEYIDCRVILECMDIEVRQTEYWI